MIPKHIAEVFAVFGEAYPKWEVRERTVEVWASLLADVPADALKRAAVQYARTSKFPPTVAELREIARGPAECSAEEAWGEIYKRRPPPNDAAKRALEAIGGNQMLRNMLTAQVGVHRAHFMRCYDAYLGRERDTEERESVEQLTGAARELRELDEDDNRLLGEEPE